MKELRSAINAAFLLSAGANTVRLEDIVEQTRSLIVAIELVARVPVLSIKELQQQRHELIADELKTARRMPELSLECGVQTTTAENVNKLKLIISALRDREQQRSFHAGLLRDQQRLAGGEEGQSDAYSMENFAYGSTPFHTWTSLTSKAPLIEAIKDLQQSASQRVTVFGSSSGSLVIFMALAWGVFSEGVEILPFLHNEAKSFCRAANVSTEQCGFSCADMLTSPLSATRILVLTSQCWDDDLYVKVLAKAERELPANALVLDYKDGLRRSLRFQELLRLETQQVSWSHSQPLFVFGPKPSALQQGQV